MIDINLFMITGISNWHIWSIDLTSKVFLPLFNLDVLLLTYKHPKLFSS